MPEDWQGIGVKVGQGPSLGNVEWSPCRVLGFTETPVTHSKTFDTNIGIITNFA